MEEWRDINGFEGLYQVSDQGRVKSLKRQCKMARGLRTVPEKILNPGDMDGYYGVALFKDGKRKTYPVAHLVAFAFNGPRPQGLVLRHFDGNSKNNVPSNLIYGTHQENMDDLVRHGSLRGVKNPRARVSEADVIQIRRRYNEGETQTSLALEYSVAGVTIQAITSGRNWSHVK